MKQRTLHFDEEYQYVGSSDVLSKVICKFKANESCCIQRKPPSRNLLSAYTSLVNKSVKGICLSFYHNKLKIVHFRRTLR